MRACILAFACGIALLQLQAELPATPLIAALAALAAGAGALAWRLRGRRWATRILASLCFALTGICWAALLAQTRLSDELPGAWEVTDIEITGVVAALPQRLERGERFEFDVDAVHTPAARVPRHILLSWYRDWDDGAEPEAGEGVEALAADEAADERELAKPVRPGERWRFTVRLKRPHGAANPHAYDYEAWLLERKLRASGTIRAAAPSRRLDAFVWRPAHLVERVRDLVRERFLAVLPDAPYVGVLVALTVGDQRAIPMEV